MENEEANGLSDDAVSIRVKELSESWKSASPEELERIKGIVRKNIPFFSRSAFTAYLVLLLTEEKKPVRETARPRREKAERTERTEKAEKKESAPEPKAERVIPEGSRTLYINVGKMKHLYAKDLSKLIQSELGITRDDIYQIRIHDKYSFVTMSEDNCNRAIEKLSGREINGRTAQVSFSTR